MLNVDRQTAEVRVARIAIVGVGAIGGTLAALLQLAGGHEITLCTRRPLRQLTVTMPSGSVGVTARNVTVAEDAEPVEWVLVATKAYDSVGAAAWLPVLCGQGAPVAVVQNGVEHRERFAPYVEHHRLLPVVIDCPAERQSDSGVRMRGAARLCVEDTRPGLEFGALFAGSPTNVESVADFTTVAWRKLCVNSAGALNALTCKPAGVLRDEAVGRLAVAMVAECVAVGRAEGAQLSDSLGEEILAHYRAGPPDAVNSLLADRLAGRRMETDARNGAVVRKGEKHGVPTPLNRMAVSLLDALQPSILTPTPTGSTITDSRRR
ncbi:MAG TPA: 2-dehydropantoate 2-reductase [Steroidobacteraceae bacterium]|nr:2-dehydropantoate 2-reductase [Steroidobacteraceae bacterium]